MTNKEKHNDSQTKDESSAGSPAGLPEEAPEGAQPDPSEESSGGPAESPDQQLAALKDQLLRKAAEFENYKRRIESEMKTLVRLANEHLVLEILPVVDDLERSLKVGVKAQDVESFSKGVEMIHQKLTKVLESHGVTQLETVGKSFDVHYHDAMMQMPKEDVKANVILEEVEKGYSMNGKVIRHAKVIVSAASDGPAEDAPKGDTE